jgi:antitoxin component of RelBE/YafQ-DinJ toxin-antitoxin module
MNQAVLTIKIDADIKADSQSLAKKLGLSLSSIIENKLREVVRERRVVFEDLPTLNDSTKSELLSIEKDVLAGNNLSPAITSVNQLKSRLASTKTKA